MHFSIADIPFDFKCDKFISYLGDRSAANCFIAIPYQGNLALEIFICNKDGLILNMFLQALANDQMVAIRCMHQTLGLGDGELSLAFGALDGDADAVSRQQLCESGVVLTSNPDMLHASVLPQVSLFLCIRGYLVSVIFLKKNGRVICSMQSGKDSWAT